jgi:hypothetical protein
MTEDGAVVAFTKSLGQYEAERAAGASGAPLSPLVTTPDPVEVERPDSSEAVAVSELTEATDDD